MVVSATGYFGNLTCGLAVDAEARAFAALMGSKLVKETLALVFGSSFFRPPGHRELKEEPFFSHPSTSPVPTGVPKLSQHDSHIPFSRVASLVA